MAPTAKSRWPRLRASDALGLAQLATQATSGATAVAEELTHAIWRTMGLAGTHPEGKNRGITGLVFEAIHRTTTLAGHSADLLLRTLLPLLQTADANPPDSYPREAVLAALNGVLGDRLERSGNPLATPMQIRCHGEVLDCTPTAPAQPLPVAGATGKVLLLVHGLCMNDLQWDSQSEGPHGPCHNHGKALAAALGYTPVFLRYNTGLHISTNGHLLSKQLEHLAAHWPVPLTEISVVAHSMGGLVVRSALHSAQTQQPGENLGGAPTQAHGGAQAAMDWPQRLRSVVFLGTPHTGAPLEHAGGWVDALLGSTRYSKPFARLTQVRSAGINDLRHGHLRDADWADSDQHRKVHSQRREPLPLPPGIGFYAVAATVSSAGTGASARLVGDGLVPLSSALGQCVRAADSLVFGQGAQWVVRGTNHMELLRSRRVTRKLRAWLAAGSAAAASA
jgi:hypothetical protein